MPEDFIGQKIIYLESVDSTNPHLSNLFKRGEVKSGTVLRADIQNQPRGQRMKNWHSEPYANLTFSIAADINLWKVKNIISLNHIIAIGVQNFLKSYFEDVEIKWPNDLMASGQKIAGILIENQISAGNKRSIIGVGVNINQRNFDAPRATSLSLLTDKYYKIDELLLEAINALNNSLALYHQNGEDHLFQLFNQNLWKRNEKHSFFIDENEKEGMILTSNMEGQLLVSIENQQVAFNNGEVRY